MNLGRNIKNLSSKFHLALRICRPVQLNKALEPKFSPASSSITLKNDIYFPKNLLLKQETNQLNSYKYQEESFFPIVSKTDLTVNKKIIEPEKSIKINIETPQKINSDNDFQLPCNSEKDMIEPTENVVSKKALNMIRIRRRKMRKHRHKKFLKKMRFEFMKRKGRKEIQKEFLFQENLRGILDESEKYCPEKAVEDSLRKINWVKPITKVKNRLAPDWVIKEYKEKERVKNLLKERLQECNEFIKSK